MSKQKKWARVREPIRNFMHSEVNYLKTSGTTLVGSTNWYQISEWFLLDTAALHAVTEGQVLGNFRQLRDKVKLQMYGCISCAGITKRNLNFLCLKIAWLSQHPHSTILSLEKLKSETNILERDLGYISETHAQMKQNSLNKRTLYTIDSSQMYQIRKKFRKRIFFFFFFEDIMV